MRHGQPYEGDRSRHRGHHPGQGAGAQDDEKTEQPDIHPHGGCIFFPQQKGIQGFAKAIDKN